MNKYSVVTFAILLTLVHLETKGQIEKGTQFWGGTIHSAGTFANEKKSELATDKSNEVLLGLKLQWGKFMRQDFMFGVEINGEFDLRRTRFDAMTQKYNYGTYGISPFLRWYKMVLPRFYVFAQPYITAKITRLAGSTDLESGDGSGTTTNNTSHEFGAGLGVVPGISYRVGERFALESDINLFGLDLTYRNIGSSGSSSLRLGSYLSSRLNSLFTLRAAFYLN